MGTKSSTQRQQSKSSHHTNGKTSNSNKDDDPSNDTNGRQEVKGDRPAAKTQPAITTEQHQQHSPRSTLGNGEGGQQQDPDVEPTMDTVGELESVSPHHRSKSSMPRTSVTSTSSRYSRGSRDSRSSKRLSFYDIVDANDINSYLLVGNQASAQDEEFLSRKKIIFIMNLSNLPLGYISPSIQYKNVFLEDEEDSDLLGVLDTCLQALLEWKRKCIETKSRILIYSFNGLSRSCSVALAHLMNEERLTLKQAWHHLKEKHPSAKPNDGFLLQLMQYEQDKLGRKLSMTMADFYSK